MPHYDYRCQECQHTFTLFYHSVSEMDDDVPACPQCEATDLDRLIKKVSIVTDEETRLERLADPDRLAGLDDADPREMGKLMREMSNELGEDVGPEFNEVIDRLESGQSPEEIEKSLPLDDDSAAPLGPPG